MTINQEPIDQLRTTLRLLSALKELAVSEQNFPLACVYRDAGDQAQKALATLEAGTGPYEGTKFAPAEEVLKRMREGDERRSTAHGIPVPETVDHEDAQAERGIPGRRA